MSGVDERVDHPQKFFSIKNIERDPDQVNSTKPTDHLPRQIDFVSN